MNPIYFNDLNGTLTIDTNCPEFDPNDPAAYEN